MKDASRPCRLASGRGASDGRVSHESRRAARTRGIGARRRLRAGSAAHARSSRCGWAPAERAVDLPRIPDCASRLLFVRRRQPHGQDMISCTPRLSRVRSTKLRIIRPAPISRIIEKATAKTIRAFRVQCPPIPPDDPRPASFSVWLRSARGRMKRRDQPENNAGEKGSC